MAVVDTDEVQAFLSRIIVGVEQLERINHVTPRPALPRDVPGTMRLCNAPRIGRTTDEEATTLLRVPLPEVVHSGVREDGHDHALADSLREAQCRVERGSARCPHEHPFRP